LTISVAGPTQVTQQLEGELDRFRGEADRGPLRGLRSRLLAVPLVWKLIGANALILLSAAVSVVVARTAGMTHEMGIAIMAVALAITFVVNAFLVSLALRPLGALEETASRVRHGDLQARVELPAMADRDMVRIGELMNLLLEGLTGDRARMRILAAQIIRAQDEERARVSRELHDSIAQVLAAAMLQLSATNAAASDGELAERLASVRQMVAAALEDVRSMSEMMHPRVLDDLGLTAALEWLARQTRELRGVAVEVEDSVGGRDIPPAVASVLYRVAQEALRNAVTHADCKSVRLWAGADGHTATLEVVDDGKGFDVESGEASRPSMGLFSIRERVALVNGTIEIRSVRGRGTRVTATVPIEGTRAN
jgi:signal transduction histidine kinase